MGSTYLFVRVLVNDVLDVPNELRPFCRWRKQLLKHVGTCAGIAFDVTAEFVARAEGLRVKNISSANIAFCRAAMFREMRNEDDEASERGDAEADWTCVVSRLPPTVQLVRQRSGAARRETSLTNVAQPLF